MVESQDVRLARLEEAMVGVKGTLLDDRKERREQMVVVNHKLDVLIDSHGTLYGKVTLIAGIVTVVVGGGLLHFLK